MDKKKKRNIISNVIFVVAIIILLFTPLGTTVKVWLNRLVAMSPTVEQVADSERVALENWVLLDENGEQADFKAMEGKVIIINFWATWCPPCIAEKPSFQALYDDYKDKVVFMFITSEVPEKVLAFKKKHQYTLPIYYERSAPPAMLYSTSLPTSYVIDKQGRIVVEKFRAADWNSAKFRVSLDKLISE